MSHLTNPRADDPLTGVTVPVSGQVGPSADLPSHLLKVHAELVSHLVVPGTTGELPTLRTSADYTAYIRTRRRSGSRRVRREQEATVLRREALPPPLREAALAGS
jgi:phospholipase C